MMSSSTTRVFEMEAEYEHDVTPEDDERQERRITDSIHGLAVQVDLEKDLGTVKYGTAFMIDALVRQHKQSLWIPILADVIGGFLDDHDFGLDYDEDAVLRALERRIKDRAIDLHGYRMWLEECRRDACEDEGAQAV
jgi:hypothetical protein